ncbi:Multiple C2 and transmembrane domain-containing protein 1 [Halotydeus destructor]|nr:Multiple C2 and transmembrane domain-containing protein 1 [Halotydeus destructor]
MDLVLKGSNLKSPAMRTLDELDKEGHQHLNSSLYADSTLAGEEISSLSAESESRQRIARLRQYPFFKLEIHLHSAKDLLAKDACGTSDPYIKFRLGNKQVYKSRTVQKSLSPKWDEYFVVAVEDAFQPLVLRAYDHDFGFQDDYLGTCAVDLTRLTLDSPTELKLRLSDTGKEEEDYWGEVSLTVTLIPKSQEEKEQFFGKGSKSHAFTSASGETTFTKKAKTQQWDSVVNVILVEGKNLPSKDENGLSDPYVKFRLGNEKYRSKVIPKELNPKWNEQFDLHTFPDQSKVLEVIVYDKDFHGKDDFIGKCTINLNGLEKEETHSIWKDLDDNCGAILLVVTISGTLGSGDGCKLVSSLSGLVCDKDEMSSKYNFSRTLRDLDDIGHLTVKVFQAQDLMAADFSGKSDPFVVLQLANSRVQTNTEYKTLSPEWNKVFTFRVKDIHEVLEVTVFDEDRDKKVEFLGKVAIPLLRVKSGEKRWYTLKDKKLVGKTKGQILLEVDLVYNPLRACVRTINPREDRFIVKEQKFKRSVFVRNVMRIKSLVMEIVTIARYINSCFQWESVPRSFLALVAFLLITFYFQIWMIPIALLLIFIKNYCWFSIASHFNANYKEDEFDEYIDGAIDDDDDEKDGKNSNRSDSSSQDEDSLSFTDFNDNALPYAFATLHEVLGAIKNFVTQGEIDYKPLLLKRGPQRSPQFYAQVVYENILGTNANEEEKKTLKEKFQTVQEVTAMVQNVLGEIASLGERVKNTFDFSVPFLSWLAVFAFFMASIVLYFIPLRYLVMAWGINKFTKKLRNPDSIPNNEVLDFLSRVPDADEKITWRELKPSSQAPSHPPHDSRRSKKKTN